MNVVKLIAVGDISLQMRNNKDPFDKVKEIFKNKDILFGNLETVLSNQGKIAEKAVLLHSPPEKVGYLKNAGFDILNIANNHIMDYGVEGLLETLDHLKKLNIKWFGAGLNINEALTPLLISMNDLGIGVLGFIFAITHGDLVAGIGGLMAGLGAVLSILIYQYGYMIVPLLTKFSRIVVVTPDRDYEIPPSQDIIIKRSGDIYYGTKFLGVEIFESPSEKSPEENITYMLSFERAISSVKHVTKFSMMVYVLDISKKKRDIETKKYEAQLKLAKEREKIEPDVLMIDKLEHEIAMWEKELDKIAKGEKPMTAMAYIMTTAIGISKEAAMAAAEAQANEIRASVSNALNARVEILKADDMLRCFEWEYMLPASYAEWQEQVD